MPLPSSPVPYALPPQHGRLPTLDALRGIFAAIVFAHHLFLTLVQHEATLASLFDPAAWSDSLAMIRVTPLGAFLAGRAPVIVFFVLSGLVLTLPFIRGGQGGYGLYVLRRIARIYLPFLASILLAAGLYWLAAPKPIPALSDWFNTAGWDAPPTPDLIARHLAMTGRPEDMRLNNVMWSLVHEMRISLVFPLLPLLVLRSQRAALVVALFCYVGGKYIGQAVGPATLAGSLLDSLRFTAFFILGSLVAVRLGDLAAIAARLGRRGFTFAVLVVVTLLAAPLSAIAEFLFATAAVGSIALAVGAPAARAVLMAPVLQWLGRVSYSLYLIHVPILLALFHLLFGKMPLAALLGLTVVVTLLASELFHCAVERPAMRIGRLLTARRQRTEVSPTAPAGETLEPATAPQSRA
jgi:peptidoglycan/LPS O-acetylase OafA/YrhL